MILGQAAAPTLDSDIMCERSDDALSPCFNAGEGDYTYSDRLRLSATGVALRPWAEFGDAGFVSMFAQAWKSSQLDLGDRQVCALLACCLRLLPMIAVPVSKLLSGRLTDSLVVYPVHHFLDAVDRGLDGA